MTTDTAPPVQRLDKCPHCGAKLPDIPISLCPYCASPLETEADRKRLESVNSSRIRRVGEHDDFAQAQAWDPPESQDWHEGGRRRWWSVPVAVTGVAVLVLLVLPPLGRGFDLGGIVLALLGVGLLVGAAYLRKSGATMQVRAIERPLLKRPGLIVDRRSDTSIRGWDGFTTYYFTIEFEDGGAGEFRFPGLGAQEDPYATNLPGVAYTRGEELLHFRHIRV